MGSNEGAGTRQSAISPHTTRTDIRSGQLISTMLQVRRCWAISLLSPAIRPCRLSFASPDTASIKFLFTDAPTSEVTYLQGGPNSTRSSTPRGLVVLCVQPPAAPN